MENFSKVRELQCKPKNLRTDAELLETQKSAFGIFSYAGKVYAAFPTMPKIVWLDITHIVLPNKISFVHNDLTGIIMGLWYDVLHDELLSSGFFLAFRNLAELDSKAAKLLIETYQHKWTEKFQITWSSHDGYSTVRFERYSDQEVFQIHLSL